MNHIISLDKAFAHSDGRYLGLWVTYERPAPYWDTVLALVRRPVGRVVSEIFEVVD